MNDSSSINIKKKLSNDFLEKSNRNFSDIKLDKILKHYENIKKNNGSEMEQNSIEVQMECDTYSDYYFAGKVAKSLGLKRVVDIGCAYGHQGYAISQQGLNYLGVEKMNVPFFKPDDLCNHLIGDYPCVVPTTDKDLGVAILSLFWNCYLYEDDTLEKQITAASKDFKYLLARVPKDRIDNVAKSFTCYEILGDMVLYRK